MEVISTLGINWQILHAQIVNFAIVLLLLTKFVYRPLLKTIDARREAISKSLQEAEEIAREKEVTEERRQEILTKADEEAGRMLETAKEEAENMRAELIAKAHAEAANIIEKGKKKVEDERFKVFQQVQETVARSIVTVCERILRREFTATEQEQLLKELETELPTLLRA